MLQTKKHTIIATLLVLILVFQMFSSAVAAAEGNGMDSVGILPMDSMNVLDESSEPLIEPVQIPQSEIPLAVGSKQAQQHGFARRAREREQELNQVVFQNQNAVSYALLNCGLLLELKILRENLLHMMRLLAI